MDEEDIFSYKGDPAFVYEGEDNEIDYINTKSK